MIGKQEKTNTRRSQPKHVAIIMDGNGRWAEQRGLSRADGHAQGQKSLKETLKAAVEFGIEVLTVYAFSTENWNRPKEEVDALMSLLVSAISEEAEELIAEGVRLQTIGDTSRLPEVARQSLAQCIERTASGKRITFVIALSYSSRDEIRRAVSNIAHQVQSGALSPNAIDEITISAHLDTAQLPELDLLIRTGGEERISNFLLWQAAYAELYFSPVLWPDFGRDELRIALEAYTSRERRFGKTSAQIQAEN